MSTAREPTRSAEPWTIQRVLAWAAEDFATRGLDSSRLDAELLLGHALRLDRVRLILEFQRELSPDELARYRELIRRRRTGEPVAYVLGCREFYGLMMRVDPRVLIPRPDTETLVEVALARTRTRSMFGHALDLCTGSGCVAIAFAKHRPTWRVRGVDVSSGALAVARENALRLGAIWNVSWLEGDLFAPLPNGERFDLIAANPPYIPNPDVERLEPGIRDFEPRLALSGGADGLEVTHRIVREAAARLRPAGVLAVEVEAGRANEVAELLERAGFEAIERTRDYGGHERVVSGQTS
jgi:release factor glutamine methyltransferase